MSNTEGGSRDRPHGRTFLFDAATGKLLEKTRWSAIIDRLPPNPR